MKELFALIVVAAVAAFFVIGNRGIEPQSPQQNAAANPSSAAVSTTAGPASTVTTPSTTPSPSAQPQKSFFATLFPFRSVPSGPTPHPAMQARAEAVRKYPTLAVKDSPMNKAFLAHYERAKSDEPHLLQKSDWPIILAARAAFTKIAAPTPTPKPGPTRDEDLWTDPSGLNVAIGGEVVMVNRRGVMLTQALIAYPAMVDVVTYQNPLDGKRQYRREPGIQKFVNQEPVFIYGVTGLVDKDQYVGKVCPAPSFSYRDSEKQLRTVRAYAVSTDLANQVKKQQEELDR